jgi:hypothetical protein
MKSILFKPYMVQAVLEGKKTQTRRIVTAPRKVLFSITLDTRMSQLALHLWQLETPIFDRQLVACNVKPKYKVGEIIYVKEPYGANPTFSFGITSDDKFYYQDNPEYLTTTDKFNAMFMPEFASRIKLEITAIRGERLWKITDADAIAEGIPNLNSGAGAAVCNDSPSVLFEQIWEEINGKGSFALNPLVWVYSFKVVHQ